MQDLIANILEVFGVAYFQDFSNTMFEEGMYTFPFFVMFAVPFLALVLYYKVFDSVRGANTTQWFVWGICACVVCFLVNLLYVNNKDRKLSLDFAFSDLLVFLLVTSIYCFLTYFIFSFLVRLISTNRRLIPFGKR